MRKFSIFALLVLLFSSFQSIPHQVFAKDNEQKDAEKIEAYVVADEEDHVELYEDEYGEVVKTLIPNNSLVVYTANDEDSEFVYVMYEDLNSSNEEIDGYVNKSYLYTEINDDIEQDQIDNHEEQSDEQVEEDVNDSTTDEQIRQNDDEDNTQLNREDEEENKLNDEKRSNNKQSKRLNGIALQSSTNVYEEKSTKSNVLKSYRQGHILIFNTDDGHDWYKATVYINGVKQTGYILAQDVDVIDGKETKKEGYALLPTVSVYESPSKEAKALKSYPYGKTIIYRTFSSKWHLATVFINGERHTGYIYHQDVSPAVQGESVGETLSGIGLKIPTNVYSSMSRDSKVLKSYKQGNTLKYRQYKADWYIATVYINGVAQTGYIHKDDVGSSNSSLNGIAQKAPTNVYSDMSINSPVLKSYTAGRQLIYRPHNSNWYAATVYVNGVRHTGYIHHQDVGNSIPSISNYALKQPTNVYASTARNSQVLKSYKQGHLLKFQPYNENWYKAVIFVSGVRKVGYIHHDDVGAVRPGRTVIIDAGHGGSDPGSSGNGIIEKSLTLSLSKLAKQMLEDAGINVVMTRSTDDYITLSERSRIANDSNADLFLSIHGNAFNGSASGIETYWYDKYASAESQRLAQTVQKEVIKATNGRDRGAKKGNFHVIRETKIPSALLEVGFIDNPDEAEKLKQKSYQQSLVQGLVNGILSFLK